MTSPHLPTPLRRVSSTRGIAYEAVVPMSAPELFSMLQNPHRHHELDGTGTVQAQVQGPRKLALGDEFTASMKMFGLPYSMTSTVVELEQDALIAWKLPAGHIWRWKLEDLGDGTTRVTESWTRPGTLSSELAYAVLGSVRHNDDGIRRTLERLQGR